MKPKTVAFVIALLILQATAALSKTRCTPIYLFGASASFNDSIVYFTDIQIIDSAWVDDNGMMLLGRSDYSYQLRSYLMGRGETNRTCLVSFATKEKDILKKMEKMRKQFTGTKKHPKKYDIREIDDDEFKFTTVTPNGLVADASTIDEKASHRAEKSKAKKSKGELKSPAIDGPKGASDAPPVIPPRQ